MKRIVLFKVLPFTSVFIAALAYGIGVGQYHWPPFAQLRAVRSMFLGTPPTSSYQGEQELLEAAFTEPLIPAEKILPPIISLDGIRRVNDMIFMPSALFFDAYREMTLTGADQLRLDGGTTPVVQVGYTLGGRSYSGYAYGELSPDKRKDKAALIIPGTGENQSYAIYKNDPENYHHGILDVLRPDYDVFVFIKPNEGVLAFHNGCGKMNEDFFVNWQLNRGSSYSATYIAQSLAIAKYLKAEYKQFVVAGLSQGGLAALLNALQSEPSAAIIASGYSVVAEDTVEQSSFDQIAIPGVSRVLAPKPLVSRLQELKTRFLFTWGTREVGVLKMEAEGSHTSARLREAENVQCMIHEGGHVFPVDAIRQFLRTTLGP